MVNEVTERSVTDELQQMIDDAQPSKEPGKVKPGDIVNRPKADDVDDLGLAVSSLTSAGYVMVYDIRDGRPFPWNRNMLKAELQKTDPKTGKRIFTTRDPGYRPKVGGYVCWLHADYSGAEALESLGFQKCEKKGIPSEYEVQRHMQKKHGRQFDVINALETRKREDARDDLNRQLLERAINGPGGAFDESVEANLKTATLVTQVCGKCGDELQSKPTGTNLKMRNHLKKCTGQGASNGE